MNKKLFVIPIAATAVAVAGCGGGSLADKSSAVGKAVDGQCSSTGYYLENRLDNTKTPMYDCWMNSSGKHKCVTYENDIAQDVTEEARLLWENTLSGDTPSCLQ